jgi:hypothetical protein
MAKKTPPVTTNLPPKQAYEGLKMLVEAYQENVRISEIERTKREEIQALKEVEIEKIRKNAKILKKFLDESFKERRENFDKFFNSLDKALEQNNIEAIATIAGSIVDIAKTSPLIQAQKQLLADYNNPDIDEIEI